ncbi:MAG: carboxypeptidase regulatory-like domain-containing protein [Gemmatimonadota bacterium]
MVNSVRIAWGAVAATALMAPLTLSAQEVRGRIVAEGGLNEPIEGAIVTLLDTGGATVNAVFTNELGIFRLTAVSVGEYHVRVDRIGFQRWESDPFDLGEGAPLMVEFEIPILPVRLADLDVSIHRQCVDNPRDAAEVELVWDEARKALESQLLAQTMQLFRFSSVVFNRSMSARGRDIIGVTTFAAEGVSQAPFRSLAATKLSADGYIQEEGETVYYYAPDATVLLSDTFQADHCFGLDREERDGQTFVGLTFEPRDGRDLPDIKGVLWLDETTNALDHVEFRYENIPYRGVNDKRIAGVVEYGRLPTGAFIVRDWYIRMPTLLHDDRRNRYQIDGFVEYGGELRDVSEPEGGAVDWRVGAGVTGAITNTMTGAPLRDATLVLDPPRGDDQIRHTGPNGEFFFDGLEPGTYELELRHALFNTIDFDPPQIEFELSAGERRDVSFDLPDPGEILTDLCGEEAEGTAVIVGRVRDRETLFPLNRALVWAEWTELSQSSEPAEAHGRIVVQSDDTRASRAGYFALCDIPIGLDIALQVSAQGGRNAAQGLRTARIVNFADLRLDPSR